MQAEINLTTVAALAKGEAGTIISDTLIRGFAAERLPSGEVSFRYRYRNAAGERQCARLGIWGAVTPAEARRKAEIKRGEVAGGADPVKAKKETRKRDANTVNAILDRFIAAHCVNLKSGNDVIAAFRRLVRPQIGALVIYDVKRGAVLKMLEKIATENGAVQSNRVLAYVRKAFNWYEIQDEDFKSPIVKGMARATNAPRERVLDADEIRDLFQALDEMHDEAAAPTCFRPFIKMLFYSASRLRMPAEMERGEINGRDWVIPGARMKGGRDHLVPLTDTMLALIQNDNAGKFVFSTCDGAKPYQGIDHAKQALAKRVDEIRARDGRPAMPRWTLHDLRRTARFIMGQNGVQPDHAERVLAHVIGGVRGVYDPNLVHAYRKEKLAALEILDREIGRILRPAADNVVALRQGAA